MNWKAGCLFELLPTLSTLRLRNKVESLSTVSFISLRLLLVGKIGQKRIDPIQADIRSPVNPRKRASQLYSEIQKLSAIKLPKLCEKLSETGENFQIFLENDSESC